MDFGYVFKHAWLMPWRHKLILKIAAVINIPTVLSTSLIMSLYMFWFPSLSMLMNPETIDPSFLENYPQQMSGIYWIQSLSIPLGLVSMVALMFGGIMTVKIVQYLIDEQEVPNFTELKAQTLQIALRVFLLNLLLYAISYIVTMGIMFGGMLLTVITAGIFLLCLIPFGIVLSFLTMAFATQANIAMIIEDLSITDTIKYGWSVLKNNLGSLTLISFVLGIIGILLTIFTVMPGIFISLFLPPMNLLLKIGLLVFFTLLAWGGYTIIFAYSGTAWVLTYLNLPKKAGQPSEPEQRPAQLKDLSALAKGD